MGARVAGPAGRLWRRLRDGLSDGTFHCLAAARHAVLRGRGLGRGAQGCRAPPVSVIAGEQAHVTVAVACRMLGLGAERVRLVGTDDQGRMLRRELETALAECRRARRSSARRRARSIPAPSTRSRDRRGLSCAGAWCHVDGAFGLWAAVSPSRRGLLEWLRASGLMGDRRAKVAERPTTAESRAVADPGRRARAAMLDRPTAPARRARARGAAARRGRSPAPLRGPARRTRAVAVSAPSARAASPGSALKGCPRAQSGLVRFRDDDSCDQPRRPSAEASHSAALTAARPREEDRPHH